MVQWYHIRFACGRPWVQSPVCPSDVREKQDVQVTVHAKREISRTQPPVERLPVERKGLNLVVACTPSAMNGNYDSHASSQHHFEYGRIASMKQCCLL